MKTEALIPESEGGVETAAALREDDDSMIFMLGDLAGGRGTGLGPCSASASDLERIVSEPPFRDINRAWRAQVLHADSRFNSK